VNIAGRSDGSLLAAVVGPAEYTKRELYKYVGGSWTTIMESRSSSPDPVFDWVPGSYREIALISNKP